ncbi:MAG: alpha/beta hydrolase, partial [Desulfobacteraceae bacterium]|nr:alpha/beta hydrolase [Desulfobacteraceae bacterium]
LYDRFRYGKSDALDGQFSGDYMHQEAFEYLPALLDNLGIKQPIIPVGHSDGGTIALLFAARFPQRTLAVISEADHVVNEDITRQGIASVVEEFEKGPLRKRLEKYHHDKTEALVRGWSGFLLSEEGKRWNIIEELRDIHAPVLAIQGRDDAFGSAEQIHVKLKNIFGDVYVSYLNNCGHVPHHEQKDIVFQTMKQFIENHAKSAG